MIKIFDECQGYGEITNLGTFTDATVSKRGNKWVMFGSGFEINQSDLNIFSASLNEHENLSPSGWKITTAPGDAHSAIPICGKSKSFSWDGPGGRHCPCYVKGFDPQKGAVVERIYYAGAAGDFMGPYTIGYLEWNGNTWEDQAKPAFTATEDWEHGSVYEPNLIYHKGKWKMWYVAGSNAEDYLVQCYSESEDGKSGWSKHQIVFPPEEKVFDFNVLSTPDGYEAIIARVNLKGRKDLPKTGLWWCTAKFPSSNIADWSEPEFFAGPIHWKPCLQADEREKNKRLVFCDGITLNKSGQGMPYCYTVECLEFEKPAAKFE